MKRKIKAVLFLGVLTTGVAVAGGVGYHRMSADPEHRAAWITKEIGERLKLSAEQATKLDAVKEELLAQGRASRSAHEEIRVSVNEMLTQPTLDQAAVLKLVQTRTTAVADSAPAIVAKVAEFYDGLDASQRATLREQVAKRMEQHHSRHRGW